MEDRSYIVFDLDDVLLDTESNLDWLRRALRKTLASHSIKVSEENIKKLHPKNLSEFNKACEEFNVKSESLWKTRNEYYIKEKIQAMKNRELTPFSDVDSLSALTEKYRLTILSDSPQEIVEFFIKEFDYSDLFIGVIGRGSELEDLQKLKPSSYPLTRLRKKINSRIMFYIGDSKKDYAFAKNNNLKFILLNRDKSEGFDDLKEVVNYILSG